MNIKLSCDMDIFRHFELANILAIKVCKETWPSMSRGIIEFGYYNEHRIDECLFVCLMMELL